MNSFGGAEGVGCADFFLGSCAEIVATGRGSFSLAIFSIAEFSGWVIFSLLLRYSIASPISFERISAPIVIKRKKAGHLKNLCVPK